MAAADAPPFCPRPPATATPLPFFFGRLSVLVNTTANGTPLPASHDAYSRSTRCGGTLASTSSSTMASERRRERKSREKASNASRVVFAALA